MLAVRLKRGEVGKEAEAGSESPNIYRDQTKAVAVVAERSLVQSVTGVSGKNT